jgi:hypothetical protein
MRTEAAVAARPEFLRSIDMVYYLPFMLFDDDPVFEEAAADLGARAR